VSKIEASADIIHKVVKVEGRTYRARIEPDLDVGGYVVHSETPPLCSSQGESVEEALEMIADAISLIVAVHEENGWPLAAE
jgi:predicted RNase H-like HicB family nuclease